MSAQIRLIGLGDFTNDTIFIHSSVEEDRINSCIDEAQVADLEPAIGSALFSYLQKQKSEVAPSTQYDNLMNGKTYTDPNGNEIIFPGLRFALIYWTYAVFIKKQQTIATSTGLVTKKTPYSEPLTPEEVASNISHYRAVAGRYFSKAMKYIKDNLSDYPSFSKSEKQSPSGPIRINAIGGDD